MKVEITDQLRDFAQRQSPDPRRRLRLAIRHLAAERGDIRALDGPLKGFHRLRVGAYRVVFAYGSAAGEPVAIRCLFAERRDVVYAVFSDMLQAQLLRDSPSSR